ncbi:MAG: AAA family ATPase, partial [Treponema sp.]|nr:AAA family ATPase [Treponema sp.]
MIRREIYMEKVRRFIDKPVVKVITGMRRCGKSVILKLIREELAQRGIPPEQILYFNFESMGIAFLREADALYAFIANIARQQQSSQRRPKRLYIMLDEVQRIAQWEQAVASFRVDLNCDIYITGSNSKLLSGNIAELLAGRYVEIRIHPLSFAEHLNFTAAMGEDKGKDLNRQFADYLQYGGLPGIHEMDINSDAVTP